MYRVYLHTEEKQMNDKVNESDVQEESVEATVELSEVEQLAMQLKESEDKYLRALAELENSKKRYEKMQIDVAKYSIADFSKELISVIDVFDKASVSVKDKEITDPLFLSFIDGIALTKVEFEKTLAKFGIVPTGLVGEQFNANFHEALYSKEDTSLENSTIFDVVEHGYKIHDRILRSAKVGIIKNT